VTLEDRFRHLSPHRQGHIRGVMGVMEALAEAHHFNPDEGRLAGWGHDLAREMSRPDLLQEARRLGLSWGTDEEAEPLLLHGPIAAGWMVEEGLGNERIWSAIRYHTTAGANLHSLAKALFIADGVEPGRDYNTREALYQLALTNLDRGYCALLQETLAYLHHRELKPHKDMLAALQECHGPVD